MGDGVSLSSVVQKAVDNVPPVVKHVGDGAAIATALGAFFDFLPGIASLLSIVWLSLQIYAWFEKRRREKNK